MNHYQEALRALEAGDADTALVHAVLAAAVLVTSSIEHTDTSWADTDSEEHNG